MTLEVARGVMKEVQGGVPGFELSVSYGAFGALGVEFNVIMRTQEFTERYPVIQEFVKRLDERYRREGIEIPYSTTVGLLPDDSEAAGTA